MILRSPLIVATPYVYLSETCNRNICRWRRPMYIYKRPIKETYKRNLQKRPIKETFESTHVPCRTVRTIWMIPASSAMSKETYKHLKETNKRDLWVNTSALQNSTDYFNDACVESTVKRDLYMSKTDQQKRPVRQHTCPAEQYRLFQWCPRGVQCQKRPIRI